MSVVIKGFIVIFTSALFTLRACDDLLQVVAAHRFVHELGG
jgi:hypothetical protein